MALELVMSEAGTVGHDTGSLISAGDFVVTTAPSTTVKIDGSGVHRGPLIGTFSGGNATGFVPGSVAGAWEIEPTATAVKADALAVVREGDTGTLTAVGTISPPTSPPTGPVTGDVVVSDAGQGDVNGD